MTIESKRPQLSDDAIALAFGWFSFGEKATVNSNPPHANMKMQQAALDELLAAGLISHTHEATKYGRDCHTFHGSHELSDVLATDHAKGVLRRLLEKRQ